MNLPSGLILVLPQKFLGIIPLFIGVELVLGISILNKAGGAFGVLSLLTGHPINFWQWLYNMSCLIILPFYISGLSHLNDRLKNVRKMALVCLVYTFDTLFGLLYTVYFCYVWFSHEDTNPTGNDARDLATTGAYEGYTSPDVGVGASSTVSKNSSQSASPARELFLTVSATLITTVVRFYFNLIIVSFSRLLIKQYSTESDGNLITEEEQQFFQSKSFISKVKKFIFEVEIKSEEYLADFFSKS